MKWLELFQREEIIVAFVVGVCLVLKVWVIRKWFDMEIEVLDVYIPLVLLTVYAPVRAMMLKRKTTSGIRWDSPLLWSAIIIIATAISTYFYVR